MNHRSQRLHIDCTINTLRGTQTSCINTDMKIWKTLALCMLFCKISSWTNISLWINMFLSRSHERRWGICWRHKNDNWHQQWQINARWHAHMGFFHQTWKIQLLQYRLLLQQTVPPYRNTLSCIVVPLQELFPLLSKILFLTSYTFHGKCSGMLFP